MKKITTAQIQLASPKQISKWTLRKYKPGHVIGNVTSKETLNYKTLKPVSDGLFCEKIFGPLKNWECACGRGTDFRRIWKMKLSEREKASVARIARKKIRCSFCLIEICHSSIRRHQMGCIQLHYPVTHIWFLKGKPNILSTFLNIPLKYVDEIVYFNEPPDLISLQHEHEDKNVAGEFEVPYYDSQALIELNRFFDKNEWAQTVVTKIQLGRSDKTKAVMPSITLNVSDVSPVEASLRQSRKLVGPTSQTKIIPKVFLKSDEVGWDKNFTSGDGLPTKVVWPNPIHAKRLRSKNVDTVKASLRQSRNVTMPNSKKKKTKAAIRAKNIRGPKNIQGDSAKLNRKLKPRSKTQKQKQATEPPKQKKLYKTPHRGIEVIQHRLAEINLIEMEKGLIEKLQGLYFSYQLFDLRVGSTDSAEAKEEVLKKQERFFKTYLNQKLQKLRLVRHFIARKMRPEWMILSLIPVLPPDLRPIIQLENGQLASSDLNDLYRRVIIRNARLEHSEIKAFMPELLITLEKKLLQEGVDTLLDNSRAMPIAKSFGKTTPLKSLAEILKGKPGRFRLNLLGKRVDYSGRSVIIVNPQLKLHQCGLPREMALELFQPLVIQKCLELRIARTIRKAKEFLDKGTPLVWKVLLLVTKHRFVLLNRAPTLHRLGIQAFQPVLTNERAINLHPLVCSAFNADFDGDQMGIHLPLSWKAQLESQILLLSSNNWVSCATGEPSAFPSQDMVLGCYYLTIENLSAFCLTQKVLYFRDFEEVLYAYENNIISLHSFIWIELPLIRNYELESYIANESPLEIRMSLSGTYLEIYRRIQSRKNIDNQVRKNYIRTTTGRVLLNQLIDEVFNKAFNKNEDNKYQV